MGQSSSCRRQKLGRFFGNLTRMCQGYAKTFDFFVTFCLDSLLTDANSLSGKELAIPVNAVYGFKSHLSQPEYRESNVSKERKVAVSKEITRLEKSNVRLSLTIPKEDLVSGYRDVLSDYTKNAQLPGFRKGKVPANVLERKFGEALKGEALSKMLENAIQEVLGDENLPRDERPLSYSQPKMEDEPKLDFEKDLTFSLVYDVIPTVNVGQWKGLEAEVPEAEVSDDDIARELDLVRERNSFVLDRDDDAKAQNDDIVTVTYCEIDESGTPVPDSQRDDFSYTLGKGQNAYMFDDEIVGMTKGETKEFVKSYPEATEEEATDEKAFFAGRTLKMRVTLTALKEKKLPDLDDELAQDVDEKFNTLDDLKRNIRERLETSLTARIRDLKISGLMEKISENTPITLPESMVKAEIGGRISTLGRNFGMQPDAVMRMLMSEGGNLNDIEATWRPAAEKALHSGLIVETLIREQNIEVSEEDLKQELEKIAADSGSSEKEVRERYGDENLGYLKEGLRERKFFDILLAENTIKAGPKVSYLDLMANNG